MTDLYPTRKETKGRFIDRIEPVVNSFAPSSDYEENGFCVIKDFFTHYDAAELLNSPTNGLITKDPNIKAVRSITGIHNSEPFKSASQSKHLLALIRGVIGGPVYIHQSRINYKSGIGSNGWHWHSDFETWHAQDGMPGMNCLTAMIPLTENNECNGSLMVIPGSHKKFYSCAKVSEVSAQENFADQKEGVPDYEALKEFFRQSNPVLITCSPGDLVLFDCNIIHGSTQNITFQPRTNLFFVYNSIDNKLVAPFSASEPRPEEMGARINIEIL